MKSTVWTKGKAVSDAKSIVAFLDEEYKANLDHCGRYDAFNALPSKQAFEIATMIEHGLINDGDERDLADLVERIRDYISDDIGALWRMRRAPEVASFIVDYRDALLKADRIYAYLMQQLEKKETE